MNMFRQDDNMPTVVVILKIASSAPFMPNLPKARTDSISKKSANTHLQAIPDPEVTEQGIPKLHVLQPCGQTIQGDGAANWRAPGGESGPGDAPSSDPTAGRATD